VREEEDRCTAEEEEEELGLADMKTYRNQAGKYVKEPVGKEKSRSAGGERNHATTAMKDDEEEEL